MTNFDERAKNWDDDPIRAERAAAVAQLIRSLLPKNKKMTAFEYGCGTGLLSFFLRQDFASITLADTSQGMLDVLSEKIKNSHVNNMMPVKIDLLSDSMPALRYDVIYSLMTLHHIPQTDSVLKKFFALLNSGGLLYIADLDAEDGSFHGESETNIHKGFDRLTLQKQVEAAGFKNVLFKTAYEISKQIGDSEKSFPVFLMTAYRP
jgi:2-polyprenyl-3-methyl-5-hydroxy-6-metoxy-1,4-benzoquinol methylase